MEYNSSNLTDADCTYNLITGVGLTVACIMTSVAGSLGNILVLVTFFTSPNLQTLSNLFIVNLSVADLLVSLVALPLNSVWAIRKTQGHCLSLEIVYSRRVFISASSCASLLILGWVSIERSIVISWPFRYKTVITRGRILIILAISWFFSMVYGVVSAFDAYNNFSATFAASSTTVCYIVITACYFRIFMVVLRQKKIQPALQENPHQPQATEKQVAKTIALVIGVFTFCFAPLTVARQTTSKYSHQSLHDALIVLALSHSATNPLIYFYRSKDYRTALKKILCNPCSHKNPQDAVTRQAWTTK